MWETQVWVGIAQLRILLTLILGPQNGRELSIVKEEGIKKRECCLSCCPVFSSSPSSSFSSPPLLFFTPLFFSSFSFSSSSSSLISGLGIKPMASGKWSAMQLQPEPLRRGHSAWEVSDLYESWCVYTHSSHPDLPQSHHKVVSTLCPHPITFQDTWQQISIIKPKNKALIKCVPSRTGEDWPVCGLRRMLPGGIPVAVSSGSRM